MRLEEVLGIIKSKKAMRKANGNNTFLPPHTQKYNFHQTEIIKKNIHFKEFEIYFKNF